MKWTDINDICDEILSNNQNITIDYVINISFQDLQKLVMSLDNFNDLQKNCNEKVLEAIQQSLIDELS
jgi:FeS assembly protein IscX